MNYVVRKISLFSFMVTVLIGSNSMAIQAIDFSAFESHYVVRLEPSDGSTGDWSKFDLEEDSGERFLATMDHKNLKIGSLVYCNISTLYLGTKSGTKELLFENAEACLEFIRVTQVPRPTSVAYFLKVNTKSGQIEKIKVLPSDRAFGSVKVSDFESPVKPEATTPKADLGPAR
ncbi:MAG: hypothetical protein IT289_08315 [Oligoflexia bacterium]|nr:hypothetical protein [Oligoflexia bacterium]